MQKSVPHERIWNGRAISRRRQDAIAASGTGDFSDRCAAARLQDGLLVSDLMAGLAVAAVALPTGIAYPAIAGLPAETGIYAAFWP
jgi:MFS superfamily sulfate permease-like transporter